jgi:hypothetical protein
MKRESVVLLLLRFAFKGKSKGTSNNKQYLRRMV